MRIRNTTVWEHQITGKQLKILKRQVLRDLLKKQVYSYLTVGELWCHTLHLLQGEHQAVLTQPKTLRLP
jgi:hypothetical protein